MKSVIFALGTVVSLSMLSNAASAASFSGFTATSDVFFDSGATFDYDPFFVGGTLFDADGLLDISLSMDLSSGTLLLTDSSFDTVLAGSLSDTMLSVDNDIVDDSFSMLFELSSGIANFAIATFSGDLDGFGTTDFLSDGVFFSEGNLQIVGASEDQAAIVPLPAGLPLFLSSLFFLGWVRRR